MKTKVLLTIVLIIMTTCATIAQESENRFAFELNGDVIFVSTEVNGATLNTGLGFEAILQYRVLPFTSLYGGWGWNHSKAEEWDQATSRSRTPPLSGQRHKFGPQSCRCGTSPGRR